jgi:hypothetical protein
MHCILTIANTDLKHTNIISSRKLYKLPGITLTTPGGKPAYIMGKRKTEVTCLIKIMAVPL